MSIDGAIRDENTSQSIYIVYTISVQVGLTKSFISNYEFASHWWKVIVEIHQCDEIHVDENSSQSWKLVAVLKIDRSDKAHQSVEKYFLG